MLTTTLSSENFLLISGLAYLIHILFKFRYRAIGTRKREDPQFLELPGWPLVGHLPETLIDSARPLETFVARAFDFGHGYSITLPGIRFIDVSKPEWIEYIQKTNFNNYVKGPIIYSVLEDVFGQGIFSIDGELWRKSRKATSTLFTAKNFKNIMVPSANKSMDGLIQVLDSASGEGRNLDFCYLMYCFTLETFIHMTFGKELGILGKGFGKKKEFHLCNDTVVSPLSFATAFDFSQEQLDFRFNTTFAWRLIEKLNYPLNQKMKAACRIIDEYAYALIDERISKGSHLKDSKYLNEPSQDLLGLLMNAFDERGCTLGRKELRDNAISLIIAGRDTTAQTLSWSFFHAIKNPYIISKIRQETSEILGSEMDLVEERVTYDNYKRFTWSYCVVLETLRLHPSVPSNFKFALAADKIPGGPIIEAGDCVRWSDWQMGRDPELWGADCGEFKPSRWIDSSGSVKQFGQFKFHAFNGGPRICLGMNLATFEAVKVLVETFHKFELNFTEGWLEKVPKSDKLEGVHSDYQTPSYRSSITLPMKEPMFISVKLRQIPGPTELS